MKKYLLLLALVCLLGNRVLAQTKSASNTSFTHEVLDFTQLDPTGGLGNNSFDGDYLVSQNGTSISFLSTRRISVSNTNGWNIWTSSTNNNCPYLQRASGDTRNVIINNLNVGDIVRIWCAGECRILTDNTATHDSNNPLVWNFNDPDPNFNEKRNNGWYYDRDVNDRAGVQLQETFNYDVSNPSPAANELKIVNNHDNGTLVIRLANQYAGIIKVEIDAVQTTPRYDYDASLEVYDMYETRDNNGAYTAVESAEFKLNNNDGYYLKFTNNDLSLNERIAIDKTNTWTFAHGIQAPSNWSNLSICNLREGDRVLIYYSGDAPIFSSNGSNGDYTGNAAYKDTWNDGMLDTNEGDHIITKGDPVEYTYCRKEGTFGNEEGTNHIWLYTSYPYVMMENGHLDLSLSNGNHTRIVKVKIYSDHQAMMVDDYDNETYTYTAYFNITGELQAKEHIVPGGLEVHVGNDNADQHANVVFSKEGPVSYVKAVDGYKIPGIYRDTNGEIQNNFNLANEAPTTGTYYRFIPETNGQMTVRFKATSLNYYRWDLKADDIYYNTDTGGGWTTEFDRSNEWPMDRSCPYYLMVQDGNNYSSASFKIDNSNNISSGAFYKNNEYCTLTLDVQAGKTYYLYGTWDRNTNDGNNIGGTDADLTQRPACGIAELLWVKFNPENKIYPLAKWVPNGTEAVDATHYVLNPDDLTTKEYELATVIGYVGATITVKKMSGNITACRPYIKRANPDDREGKLMIDGITFNGNPGGTILIKIGDPEAKTSPLYALTIAYSTDPQYNGENGKTGDEGRGHTWDLTTNSLYGMKWDLASDAYVKSQAPEYNTTFNATNTGGYATPTPMGTYFKDYYANEAAIANFTKVEEVWDYFHNTLSNGINTGSLLEEEIDYNDHHGITRSDWSFNYNLVYGDKLYDPIFSNKYDMEGDNADMIWDTEGTVIRTSANQSVIFNEFTGSDIHTSEKDPNRYVGILEGGEFRIPWLMPNDRVIIYMGTGTGRYTDEVKFNIRGAYDAVHNVIASTDDYIVGGSHWDGANGDKNYRGCYHFFAQGDGNGGPADMVFKMKEGSLCKIYKIQIYRGDRIITNEIVGAKENDNKYFLWSRAYDPNDSSDKAVEGEEGYTAEGYTDTHNYNWALKYLGKDQQLANGTGKNSQKNEIIAKTGKYSSTTPALTNNRVDPEDNTSKVESFTYKHQLGEIGTFRMRGKDMEKNMNYVADYADHNVTIAYQETQKYPYTWDFTDVTGIEANVTNLFDPEEQLGEGTTAPTGSGLTDDIWNSLDAESYQKTARDLSLWEVHGTSGNYFLRLNSQTSQSFNNPMERDNIFESAKEIGGNQVWAKGTIVPEMQGLWFYTEYTNPNTGKSYNNYQKNGQWNIIQGDANNVGGLEFTGSEALFKKIVIPNVPANAAVYLRMQEVATSTVKYAFGQGELSDISNSETAKFYKVDDTENDYIVALLNTNSSKSNLTLSLNGYRVQKLAVSEDPKQIGKTGFATESRARDIDHNLTAYLTGKKIKAYTAKLSDDHTKVVLTQFGGTETGAKILEASQDGAMGGCILYHDGGVAEGNNTNRTVSILGGGFHEFVADMHDKDSYKVSTTNNIMKSFKPITGPFTVGETFYVGPTDDSNTNLVLSAKKYNVTVSGASAQATEGYDVFFVRVDPNGNNGKGATLKENSAYIQLPTSEMKPWANGVVAGAKLSIVFEDELFGEINGGIATGISEAAEENGMNGKAEWYSLDGQKLNGVPTAKGLYIVNGKKVLVK